MQIDKLRGPALDQLFEAILSLKDIEECYRFFDDLCTMGEIQSLAQRYDVARMLIDGYTYQKIEKETGASAATISRVKRCIKFGNDGYQMTLSRIRNKGEHPQQSGNPEDGPEQAGAAGEEAQAAGEAAVEPKGGQDV